jgi:hypothetical protein
MEIDWQRAGSADRSEAAAAAPRQPGHRAAGGPAEALQRVRSGVPSAAGQQSPSLTRAASGPAAASLTARPSNPPAVQALLGNCAIARAVAHAAPRVGSLPGNDRLEAILANPARAHSLAGNRAVARILARKKTRDQVKAAFGLSDSQLESSEKRYNDSLKRGKTLLADIEANAAREPQQKNPKEQTKGYAATLGEGLTTLKGAQSGSTQSVTVNTVSMEGSFINEVDLGARKIAAAFNERGGGSIPNSEAFWWQYKKVLHGAFSDPATYKEKKRESLAHIVRSGISNDTTLDTMRWCQGSAMGQGWFVVRPTGTERDDFCALLGTPNGTAAAYLLIQHGVSFTKKTIESIEYSLDSREMRIHFA